LKINVSKIPEGGMVLQFERDGEWFRRNLPGATPPDFVPDRIDIACTAWRMKENVFIEGTVATAVDVPCCRCLEMIRLPLRSSFKYTFTPPPSRSQDEVELNAADLDFAYYEGDVIDLDTVILEQILLQIPIKLLCAESCRGLCLHCGINLNKTSSRGKARESRGVRRTLVYAATTRDEAQRSRSLPLRKQGDFLRSRQP
jgi:uncharacterized protein